MVGKPTAIRHCSPSANLTLMVVVADLLSSQTYHQAWLQPWKIKREREVVEKAHWSPSSNRMELRRLAAPDPSKQTLSSPQVPVKRQGVPESVAIKWSQESVSEPVNRVAILSRSSQILTDLILLMLQRHTRIRSMLRITNRLQTASRV